MFKAGQDPNQNKHASFKYSSYENPTLNPEQIKELEDETPPVLRAQELHGEFLNRSELQIFQPEWWKTSDKLPEPQTIMKTFISIDTAFGIKTVNDESALTVWYKLFDGDFWCVDCWHGRLDFPTLVEKVKEYIANYKPDNVVIENKASGQSLIQVLQHDLETLPVSPFDPQGDKVDRATSITTYLQSGRVHLKLNEVWNKELINQCTVFPLGNNDDMVDTISQALLWARMTDAKSDKIVTRKIIPNKPIPGYASSYMPFDDRLQGYSVPGHSPMRGYKI
jgi:predicted phage terminase large subunit-like protein